MKKLFCSALCLLFSGFTLHTAEAFSDVLPDNANAHIFNELQERGIMGALPNDTFQPYKITTRAEALTVALRAGGIVIPNDFDPNVLPPDVDPNSWYASSVARALELRFIGEQGYEFRPDDAITKAEFLTFLFRSTQINLKQYEKRTQNIAEDIAFDDWYAPTFAFAKRFQIAHLPADRLYRPHKVLSRQEIAVMTHRQLQVFYGDATAMTFLEMKANIDQFMTLLRAEKPQLAQQHLQIIRDLTSKLAQQHSSTDSIGAHALSMSMQHFTDSLQSIRHQKKLSALSNLHLALKQAERAEEKSALFAPIAQDFQGIIAQTLNDMTPRAYTFDAQ